MDDIKIDRGFAAPVGSEFTCPRRFTSGYHDRIRSGFSYKGIFDENHANKDEIHGIFDENHESEGLCCNALVPDDTETLQQSRLKTDERR
jgi:hypothetical protein